MSVEEEAQRIEWFNALKPGDEVVYYSTRSEGVIRRVKNRTPGGKVRLDNEELFDSACRIYRRTAFGSSYQIAPVTEHFRREQDHRALLYYFLHKVKWGEVPLETLREVQSILDRPKEIKEFSVETNQTASEGELLEGTIYRDETTRGKARIFAHRILGAVPHEGENYEPAMTVRVLGEEVQ